MIKKVLEKIFDEYIKYKLKEGKNNVESDAVENDTLDYDKWNLDDYDDWTEEEAEDLLTWGQTDLLHN